MSGQGPTRMPDEHEADLDQFVHDWLEDVIEPLPPRIKDEVVVQASVVGQRGRWPWQRRHPRLRLDTLSLGFAPVAVVAVLLAVAAMSLALLFLQPSDETVPLPATSPTPVESPLEPFIDSTAGFTFEEVEPGVRRLIDDGAGHDSAAIESFDRGPWRLSATPDGTVWLSQWGGDGTMIGFGVAEDLRHPIGPGSTGIDADKDGLLWVISNGVASWDGDDWSTYEHGQNAGGLIAAHPDGGVVISIHGESETRFGHVRAEDPGDVRSFAVPFPDTSGPSRPMHLTVTPDGSAWVILPRLPGVTWVETESEGWQEFSREPFKLMRSDGGAWQEVRPLGDDAAAEPREIVLDRSGRLVVRLGESVVDPERTYPDPYGDEAYGDREWIVRREHSGEWTVLPSHDGFEMRPERLLTAGVDSVWTVPQWPVAGGPGGIVQVHADGTRRAYLDGVGVEDAVITSDGQVWVAAASTQTSGADPGAAVYVITPQATPSMIADGPEDATTDFVLEPVEPGVQRLIDDGAGHDESVLRELERPPFRLSAAPDGTVWLSQPAGDTIIGLGVPEDVRHPLGPGTGPVEFERDGRMWVALRGIASWDGVDWVTYERVPGSVGVGRIAAHPDGGVVATVVGADGTEFWRFGSTDSEPARFAAPYPRTSDDPERDGYAVPTHLAVTADGSAWLIEPPVLDNTWVGAWDTGRLEWFREPARLLRSDGGAWEEVRPLGDEVLAEPRGLALDPAGNLVVYLGESVVNLGQVDQERTYEATWGDEAYGDREWIVRREGGEWTALPSHEGSEWRPGYLLAADHDSVWTSPPCPDLGGIEETHAEGRRTTYLEGVCVQDAVIARDGRVWALGTDTATVNDMSGPDIYIITPRSGDPTAIEVRDDVTIADGPGEFSPAGSLTAPRRLGHTATLLRNGRVLVIGGDAGLGATLDAIEAWDPEEEDAFERIGSLAEARLAHTATLLSDGRVLVVGGFEWERAGDGWSGAARASAEIWDPGTDSLAGSWISATESFRRLDPLAEARYGHTATRLHDGRVLVVGGDGANGALTSAEIWDPKTASFGPAGSLGTARITPTATLLPDGRVLVIGGDPGPTDSEWIATAEVWHPDTGSFEPAGSLSARLDGHTATLLPDGRVLVVGLSDAAFEPLASAAIWDPATEAFTEVSPLSDGRVYHTATSLPDGRVLVVGGADNRGQTFTSAEAWDPAAEAFTSMGRPDKARQRHTATLLPDGRVLVIGGSEASASAEIWTPGGEPPEATDGYVLEPVEPGVQRLIDDGAGHDASDIPDSWKWLHKLTAAPDGTLWLPRLDEILHFGEEGFVENPIGPGALELDIDLVGDLWVRNGSPVLTPDGSVIGERQVETDPRVVEMVRHPEAGVVASLTYADDRNELRHWTSGMDGLGELLAPPLLSEGTDWSLVDTTVASDGTIWAIELRYWAESSERLPARLVRTDGDGWEVVPLAEVGVEVEPWAIELAADGRLLVDLVGTGADPGRGPDERLPIIYARAGRWLAELGVGGEWTVTSIEISEDTPWQAMAATTKDGAWFPLGEGGDRCRGVALLSDEGVERFLTDKCVYGLAVTPDERIWVTASDHGGHDGIDEPQVYVIEPRSEAPSERD